MKRFDFKATLNISLDAMDMNIAEDKFWNIISLIEEYGAEVEIDNVDVDYNYDGEDY